ncbi:MAG: diaminopimelate decarboxylase [Methylophaga sp.]|nr:MAG: diaminopimelate decarboxylase [Methylophaga sp.]
MSDAFNSLSSSDALSLVHQFGTPLFLIERQSLLARYQEFSQAIIRHTSNGILAYSYKTNPLSGLIRLLHDQGAWAEVVSEDEYKLARSQQIPGSRIIFNGPVKSDQALERAIRDKAIINIDHFEELDRLNHLGQMQGITIPVGLRVMVEDHDNAWDRFGFSLTSGDFADAVRWIAQQPGVTLKGLHSHIGTNIRDLTRFHHLANSLAEARILAREYNNDELDWIDVGGGLAGISPRWEDPQHDPYAAIEINDYLDQFKPLFQAVPHSTQIFFEPGRTLVDACGGLLSQVQAVRFQNKHQAVYIMDAGINTTPTVSTYRHPIRVVDRQASNSEPQEAGLLATRLLGPSCMNHDILYQDVNLPPLRRGDLILINGLGAYNASRAVPFIHLRPGAVLWCGTDITPRWLRRPETFEHSQQLEREAD